MINYRKLTMPVTPGFYWWHDTTPWGVCTTPAAAKIVEAHDVFYIASTDHINLPLNTFMERFPGAVFSDRIEPPAIQ